MRKFNKAIDSARLFYQTCGKGRVITESKLKSAQEFYNTMIIINACEQQVIFQSHKDAEFSRSLVNKVMNSSDFTQIQADDVFSRCSRSIRQNYTIKRDIPMYIFNFSFSKNAKMICTIFKSFNIPFSLKDGSLRQKYDFQTETFKHRCGDSDGICSDNGDCVLVILNSDSINQTVVNHQIFHYLRMILQKQVGIVKNSKFEQIDELQLTVADQQYLFDRWQFETHIKVDLVNQLEQMYWKYYSTYSREQFVNMFIESVQKDPKNVIKQFMPFLMEMKNDDTTALRLFAGCYLVRDKLYLLNAVKWLKESFSRLRKK